MLVIHRTQLLAIDRPRQSAPREIPNLSEKPQAIGIVDAMTSGLTLAARRPWLALIPFALDLFIWLAPPLSVSGLLDRLMVIWEALVRVSYPPDQMADLGEILSGMKEMAAQLGSQINLFNYLTGSWLSVPSAVVTPQSARLTFVSDMIFAPVGLTLRMGHIAKAPWQPPPIEIGNVWLVFAIVILVWLVGQLFVTSFLRWAAQRPAGADGEKATGHWDGARGFARLFGRLAPLSLLVGATMLFLRLPLGFLLTLIFFTGSSAGAMLFAIVGGITLWLVLWLLTSLYFAGDAILVDGQSLLGGLLRSISMVRVQSLATIGVAVAVNLIVVGFRVVWGLVGQNPAGAVLAIAGNAFLCTAMMLAIFVYYEGRRRQWEALAAGAGKQTGLRNRMKD